MNQCYFRPLELHPADGATMAVIMVVLCNRADHYIFMLWFVLLSFFSSPNLSGQRLDVYHTLARDVALVRI